MPPLTDPERLRCYRNALSNWNYDGYVNFKDVAWRELQAAFPRCSKREIGQLLHQHVRGGGEIDEQVETREEWNDHDFHYDLRVQIRGRLVYFETLLIYAKPDDPDDPSIYVVSIHP
jgi:hypothetical protein